jgi:2-amino-4-hydroxy-6-hydroxymethyldihydropteridine diphosphokinase
LALRLLAMTAHHIVYISVGSNLGDKLENCRQAIAALASTPQIRITRRSRFYQTEPVDFLAQDWFVNGVIRIESTLGPFELLERLQALQRLAGRADDGVRFGPRVLDLDLLMYDQMVLEDPRLMLPHPRMHRRRFVLQPFCDIDPEVVHPLLGKDMRSLLSELEARGQQVVELG